MADTNRNQPQPNRGQQQGSQDPQRRQNTPETQRTQGQQRQSESWRDDETDGTEAPDPNRATREPSSVAQDRGRGDIERRGFSSDRESDELGSEFERETGIESDDEADTPPGRSNR